jgi:signal peptidase II
VIAQHGHLFDATAARIGLGAALGGATANVVDRLWRGGVVDFIDLRFWPVFNLADCAIVGGIVLTLAFIR